MRTSRMTLSMIALLVLLASTKTTLANKPLFYETQMSKPYWNAQPIRPFNLKFDSQLKIATQLLKKKDYLNVVKQLEKLKSKLRTNELKAQWHYLSGMAHMGLGDFALAGLHFVRIELFYPESSCYGLALYRLAQVHERLDRHDLAGKLYVQTSQLPSSVNNSPARGRASRFLQKFELANTPQRIQK